MSTMILSISRSYSRTPELPLLSSFTKISSPSLTTPRRSLTSLFNHRFVINKRIGRVSPIRAFNAGDESKGKESDLNWPILKRWDVPWKWQTVSLTSLACGLSITTAVTIGVLFGITKSFPLSEDIFRYDLREPFNPQRGWLLWAGVGLVGAIAAMGLLTALISLSNSEIPKRETDALARLLPLIGSSSVRVPTPVAVLISAAVFALAHLTPSEFPQLFILGAALGFIYAQTRNLLCPIALHACWNSGVILFLTFIQLQGYDVREMLQGA